MNTFAAKLIAAAAFVIAFTVPFSSQARDNDLLGAAIPGMPTSLDSFEAFPTTGLLMAEKDGTRVLVSAEGRYVITGDFQITDAWHNGRAIDSTDDLLEFGSRIDFSMLPLDKLLTVSVGRGPKKFVAFVDPRCGYCHRLFVSAREMFETHTFTFVLVPVLGEQSRQIISQMNCAIQAGNEDAAVNALYSRNYAVLARDFSQPDCESTAYKLNLFTAQLLGVTGVPFMINEAGVFQRGFTPQLTQFAEREK